MTDGSSPDEQHSQERGLIKLQSSDIVITSAHLMDVFTALDIIAQANPDGLEADSRAWIHNTRDKYKKSWSGEKAGDGTYILPAAVTSTGSEVLPHQVLENIFASRVSKSPEQKMLLLQGKSILFKAMTQQVSNDMYQVSAPIDTYLEAKDLGISDRFDKEEMSFRGIISTITVRTEKVTHGVIAIRKLFPHINKIVREIEAKNLSSQNTNEITFNQNYRDYLETADRNMGMVRELIESLDIVLAKEPITTDRKDELLNTFQTITHKFTDLAK